MEMSRFWKLKDSTKLVCMVDGEITTVKKMRKQIIEWKKSGIKYQGLIKEWFTLKQVTRWDKMNGVYEECDRCHKNKVICKCKFEDIEL